MSVHSLNLHRIARIMDDPDAVAPAEDLITCSRSDQAYFWLTVLTGSLIVGLTLFAWVSS